MERLFEEADTFDRFSCPHIQAPRQIWAAVGGPIASTKVKHRLQVILNYCSCFFVRCRYRVNVEPYRQNGTSFRSKESVL